MLRCLWKIGAFSWWLYQTKVVWFQHLARFQKSAKGENVLDWHIANNGMWQHVELARNRKNDDMNRSHSPLSVVSKSKITQQQVAETVPWRKRHFIALQFICRLCKDIVYHCTIVRQRCVSCNVSIVSPRLARAYNPWQHFYEIIGNFLKLLIYSQLKWSSTARTLLVKVFLFLFLARQINFSKTSQRLERTQSSSGKLLGKLENFRCQIQFNLIWQGMCFKLGHSISLH